MRACNRTDLRPHGTCSTFDGHAVHCNLHTVGKTPCIFSERTQSCGRDYDASHACSVVSRKQFVGSPSGYQGCHPCTAWLEPPAGHQSRHEGLNPRRLGFLSPMVHEGGIRSTARIHPEPRPRECEDRLLRSPLMSAESESNLAALRSAHVLHIPDDLSSKEGARVGPTEALAWRGHATLATRRFASCAVVGSSSAILDSEDGHMIDRAELVLRMNHPRYSRLQLSLRLLSLSRVSLALRQLSDSPTFDSRQRERRARTAHWLTHGRACGPAPAGSFA